MPVTEKFLRPHVYLTESETENVFDFFVLIHVPAGKKITLLSSTANEINYQEEDDTSSTHEHYFTQYHQLDLGHAPDQNDLLVVNVRPNIGDNFFLKVLYINSDKVTNSAPADPSVPVLNAPYIYLVNPDQQNTFYPSLIIPAFNMQVAPSSPTTGPNCKFEPVLNPGGSSALLIPEAINNHTYQDSDPNEGNYYQVIVHGPNFYALGDDLDRKKRKMKVRNINADTLL